MFACCRWHQKSSILEWPIRSPCPTVTVGKRPRHPGVVKRNRLRPEIWLHRAAITN